MASWDGRKNARWEQKGYAAAAVPSAVEVYRRTQKPRDLVWNRFVCRPPAAVIVAALAGTRVTPNQITLVAFVVATGSVAAIALAPGYWGLVAAVLLFEFSYVLDCVDGMLARWRGTASPEGQLLDFLMDEIKAFMVLGAVAYRLHAESGDDRFLLAGIGGLIALATGIAITTFQRRPEIAPPAPAEPPEPRRPSLVRRAIGLAERVAQYLIHYPSYVLLVAVAGRIDLYFFPYVAVNALYALRALASVAVRFGR